MSGRGLTTPELDAATAPGRVVTQLIEVLFDSGPLRMAMGGISITDPTNGNTFSAIGQVLQLDEARESAGSTEGLTAQLSGLDPAIVTLAATEPYRGRVVRIYEAFLNDSWQLVAAPRVEWLGRLAAMGMEEQQGGMTVSQQVEHYEAELRRARPRRYTAADQHRLYPSDLGCDRMEALVDMVLTWPNKEIQQHQY